MNVLRSSVYTSIATLTKLLAALVVLKLVALYAGPEGVGRLGQFLALMSVLAVLAGGGIATGVVKYVAEYRNDAAALGRLFGTSLWYTGCASVVISMLVLLFSGPLAHWLFADRSYQPVICALALAQMGIALVNYILAVINGFSDFRGLAIVQVGGSVLSVLLVAYASGRWHLHGVLIAWVSGQLFWLLSGALVLSRSAYFSNAMLRVRYDPIMVRKLATFSIMTLTSTLVPQLATMLVRDHLAEGFGWHQVGYWQAVSRVSDAYLLFFTTVINVYYLPRLASLHGRNAITRELWGAYCYLMPSVILAALAVYICREWVTWLLFDAEFSAAVPLYGAQLFGDVVKIAAFLLSYVMLAKAMTRVFVISECVFAVSYIFLVFIMSANFGVIGAVYAFIVNYVLYFLFNLVVVRRHLVRLE
ncbi:O-antigen flippase [Xanthomonas cucurbitae]|uniref:O-antigen flippase n=1 Tax=Xanthomonas cucurbitae TaxID=56453 RepID=A0A2S7DXY2_9XANT|nr:O-antigen translocase [Xanthomonas cucurbitae]PPU78703.1 O-antigen flippase [Xanthomonas cucurbitae]WDM77835.1 O-antigen translocase [Xanthomonas cucurbitae]WDM81512.1 O-antigen translocase [Xanthomonas cucurbitae]